MEFTFTPIRIGIFVSLLIAFWFLGGFTPPASLNDGDFSGARHLGKSWGYCMILFVTGAISSTLVEHRAGNIDPTSLRAIYIVIGLICMAAALAWNQALGTI